MYDVTAPHKGHRYATLELNLINKSTFFQSSKSH